MQDEWQPIETAPKGSGMDGPDSTRHPDYVSPPKLRLWSSYGLVVGLYDWYYHEGYGAGAKPGVPAWRCAHSGEPLYDVTHWKPADEAPKVKPCGQT